MIIYFSGTGNSHSVANKLSAALGDKAVPLIKLLENPEQFNPEKEKQYRHPGVTQYGFL